MNELNNQMRVQRNDNKFLFTETDEEVIAMHLEKGNYIGINKVGSIIWNIIGEPKKIEDVINICLKNMR